MSATVLSEPKASNEAVTEVVVMRCLNAPFNSPASSWDLQSCTCDSPYMPSGWSIIPGEDSRLRCFECLKPVPESKCAVCGFSREENQCKACRDIEIGKGKGEGKGVQAKGHSSASLASLLQPIKGKGKGHASASLASLLPMLTTAAGVLLSAPEAEIEQEIIRNACIGVKSPSDVWQSLFAEGWDPSDVCEEQGPNLAACRVSHHMARAAYNAMTVYRQGYKAKGKGKGKDGKVQKGQVPRTPTAGDGQLMLGKDGKVHLNAIDIDEGNAKGKGMKGDKETMAYYKGKKGNDPSLYHDMAMAFEEANFASLKKALEQGKRPHRSRSPGSHH